MFDTYKKKVHELHGTYNTLSARITKHQAELIELRHLEDIQQKTLVLMQESAKDIQNQIVLHITDVVNTALEAMFPNRYTFKIDFPTKNNKTNADMYLIENGFRIPIRGALLDLTSISLRMAVWSLSGTDAVLLIDEPMTSFQAEALPLVTQLFKQLAEEMGLQIILVSHTPELKRIANKVIRIGDCES